MKAKRIVLGSDHAGFELKAELAPYLSGQGYIVDDKGTFSASQSVDYPDYGEKVALEVREDPEALGIIVCGSGIGISIAANKVPGIRAALVGTEEEARLSRLHNNANVLALAGRPFDGEKARLAKKIADAWLTTDFEGGRHHSRIDKISALEKKYC